MLCAGVVVYEYELKIGWGKSVALPSQALPAPPPGHMAIRSKEVLFIIIIIIINFYFLKKELIQTTYEHYNYNLGTITLQ